MNINGSLHKIEASIWETIISLMSNSASVRKLIQRSAAILKDHEFFWLIGLILAWTAAGLTVGYFIGFDGLR